MTILTGFPYYQQSPVDDWEGTYNGWHNRATWNVALWFSSDQSLYEAWRDESAAFADASWIQQVWTATRARDFATAHMECMAAYINDEPGPLKGKTPDGDLLSEVRWGEIADSWNESWADH